MKLCLATVGLQNNWISVFIYNVMTEHTSNAGKWKETFHLGESNTPAATEVDVTVLVNGVPVSFEHFIKTLEEQYDNMLAEKAEELIEKHFGDLTSTLEDMERNAKDKLREVLPSWNRREKY